MSIREDLLDVAVVGAGPAGSSAAEIAAKNGADVILIERKREIGSPVQCGGFLPEAHELRELLPRAELPETLAEVPERYVLHRTKVQRFYAPSGRSKEFEVDGRVIDRRGFDRDLAHRAARAGARVLVNTRAQLTPSGLHLSGRHPGVLEPRIVIGADGPSSDVARAAGMAARMDVGVCLEYEIANVDIDPEAAEMYFGTRWAPGGYAWIIPLGGDVANVGVGVRTSYLDRGLTLRAVLDGFIEHPSVKDKLRGGVVTAVMRGLVPAGGMPPLVQKGNVLLAGDAAGHVMATSGGGIPLAMVAGNIAGEVAAGYAMGECDLAEYPSRIEKAIGQELENSVRIKNLVEKVMRSDRMMDALIAMLPADQMKATQRGQIPPALNKLVAKLGEKEKGPKGN